MTDRRTGSFPSSLPTLTASLSCCLRKSGIVLMLTSLLQQTMLMHRLLTTPSKQKDQISSLAKWQCGQSVLKIGFENQIGFVSGARQFKFLLTTYTFPSLFTVRFNINHLWAHAMEEDENIFKINSRVIPNRYDFSSVEHKKKKFWKCCFSVHKRKVFWTPFTFIVQRKIVIS